MYIGARLLEAGGAQELPESLTSASGGSVRWRVLVRVLVRVLGREIG
ncbi:MAG: hypothetical protein ACYDGY_01235 [Acidimicrobiales bacterium]